MTPRREWHGENRHWGILWDISGKLASSGHVARFSYLGCVERFRRAFVVALVSAPTYRWKNMGSSSHPDLPFEELPDGVLVLTAAGVVEFANSKFLEMVGRESAGVVGAAITAIVAEEDMLHLVGVEGMFQHPASDLSMIFCGDDARPRRLLVSCAPSRDRRRILLTTRATGVLQEELASTTRWAASEQERAHDIARARDALTEKNLALRVAQEALETAYTKLQDEAERRLLLERELRLAQKLEGIGQLAAGIAHEINTPMQYVGDNVAFLERAFGKIAEHLTVMETALEAAGEEARALVDTSKAQLKLGYLLANTPKALRDSKVGIQHVSSIVRAMKSFAHVDQDEKVPGDVNQAIQDTLMVAQSEYKSHAVVETDLGGLPQIMCFPGRLNQVLLNLVVNAAHAIAEAKPAEGGKISVTSRGEDGVIAIRIADNGAGIPEAIQHKIFDQFFTTKPVGKGTGQGLSLARSIVVDAHGGTLSFTTEPGRGTAFTIRLPVDGRTKLAPV
ncbi:MAG: PAS domain-containing sensor histidine kinase [Pseudomonadota bacterium]